MVYGMVRSNLGKMNQADFDNTCAELCKQFFDKLGGIKKIDDTNEAAKGFVVALTGKGKKAA